MPESALFILAGYLIGSISTAIIISRLLNLPDPRSTGSGNPGATNMLRSGGKKAGALTLLGDMFKGLLPVLLAKAAGATIPIQALAGLAAFFGHLYPVFFGFRGGKGVATNLGIVLGLYWPVGLAAIGTWLLMAFLFRISSLAALVSALVVPAGFWWLKPEPVLLGVSGLVTLILYWRHRSNIAKLIKGTEGRIGERNGDES